MFHADSRRHLLLERIDVRPEWGHPAGTQGVQDVRLLEL
jgi:hypothetical protein